MTRPQTSQLTKTHSRILQSIVDCLENFGHASITELVNELGLAGNTSLTPTLKIMQRNGFIEICGGGERGRRRTINLTTKGKIALGFGGLSVLGSIPAGPLADVLEQCETILDYNELLPHKPGDFLLVVQGDSMIGDGIFHGDKVLLRHNVELQNGEIAAVHVGEDYLATLKHIHFGPGRAKLTLKASNPKYKDIIAFSKEVQVVGVYKGLIRIV